MQNLFNISNPDAYYAAPSMSNSPQSTQSSSGFNQNGGGSVQPMTYAPLSSSSQMNAFTPPANVPQIGIQQPYVPPSNMGGGNAYPGGNTDYNVGSFLPGLGAGDGKPPPMQITGGQLVDRPGSNGLTQEQAHAAMEQAAQQHGLVPGGVQEDTSWKGAPRPGLAGGTIASWDGYSQDPTFKGYWDSEFYTPNRNNSWQGNETPWSGYYDNMEVSGGSPTERGFFHQYLDSIGRSDLYSKPDSVTPNPGQTWKEGGGGQNPDPRLRPMPFGGGSSNPEALMGGMSKWGRLSMNGGVTPLPGGGITNRMPAGFTGGGGGRAITPWTNSVTGETWNAPSTGFTPPSGDWQQGGGQKFTGGLPRPATSTPSLKRNIFGT